LDFWECAQSIQNFKISQKVSKSRLFSLLARFFFLVPSWLARRTANSRNIELNHSPLFENQEKSATAFWSREVAQKLESFLFPKDGEIGFCMGKQFKMLRFPFF
jgi:hypothetical protein